MSSIKKSATSSLKWSAIDRLTTQSVQLIVMLILARSLGPQAFGLVGMLAVFIAISQVFVDSGMSSALIRKLDRTEEDFATAFYFNIGVSLICYTALAMSASSIADFYKQPELESLTQALGLVVIINAFAIIQRAKLSIKMDFKTQAKASLLAVAVSSIVALTMAYWDMGVWTLIGQTLVFSFCNALFLNVFHPWWPSCKFSNSSFKELFGFGSKLLASGLIDSFYQNIYQIIIGKLFHASDVGHFAQANQLVKTPASTMTTVIQRVTYPMLSNIQDDNKRLESSFLLTLRLAATVIFPLMFGLAIVANPLLPMLLGEEWMPAASLVTILSFGLLLYPIHAINLNYLQVKGRSDLFLKLEIVKKIITTIILVFTVQYGIIAICIGVAIQSYIAFIINTYYNGKLSSLGTKKQIKALLPIWVLSFFSCIIAWLAGRFIFDPGWGSIGITITCAIVIYVGCIRCFQSDLYGYIHSTILSKKEYQTP